MNSGPLPLFVSISSISIPPSVQTSLMVPRTWQLNSDSISVRLPGLPRPHPTPQHHHRPPHISPNQQPLNRRRKMARRRQRRRPPRYSRVSSRVGLIGFPCRHRNSLHGPLHWGIGREWSITYDVQSSTKLYNFLTPSPCHCHTHTTYCTPFPTCGRHMWMVPRVNQSQV